MGNPKQKWTAEEEEALRAGIAKHGTGKWKLIQKDPEFNPYLFSRSNIDLKDKWRNMNVSAGALGPREKSRTLKPKSDSDALVPTPTPTPAPIPLTIVSPVPVSNLQTPAPVAQIKANPMVDDSSKGVVDGKTAPKYDALIYEAIQVLNEQNGVVDTNAIVSYIEQREMVGHRRQLTSRLRRLVGQDKLEKVENCYKIKSNAPSAIKVPTPKQIEVRPRQLPSPSCINSTDTVEEAAIEAACRIADAENKSYVAAEAVREAERVSKMAEESDSLLQLAAEIFEKCERGEIVVMA